MRPLDMMRELQTIADRMSAIILSTNYCRRNNSISWGDYKSGIDVGVNYLAQYRKIINDRQYSFLLNGGHAVQFYYEWTESERLSKVRQALYPAPYCLEDLSDEELDLEVTIEELLSEGALPSEETLPEREQTPPRAQYWSHVRFDYDEKNTSHDQCHLQHSAVNSFRLPCRMILPPLVFMVLVCNFVHVPYMQHISDKAWFKEAKARAAKQWIEVPILDAMLPFIAGVQDVRV